MERHIRKGNLSQKSDKMSEDFILGVAVGVLSSMVSLLISWFVMSITFTTIVNEIEEWDNELWKA